MALRQGFASPDFDVPEQGGAVPVRRPIPEKTLKTASFGARRRRFAERFVFLQPADAVVRPVKLPDMTILPAAYLPSVEYCARWAQQPCTIDAGEHFVKRSERNRACILTAGGVMKLTVQAVHADRPRQPMRDMRIDYSKRWQHQHWTALRSAYRGSPYFDHYAPHFEPFYTRRFDFLLDYDLRLIETLAALLGLPVPPVSEVYLASGPGDTDLRPKRKEGADFVPAPYVQVFADRFPFTPNLSIVDLLFCEGPRSCALLRQCRL